jgi:predicted ATPase/DNA-binding CsgD family transcriptional regulator
MKKAKLSPAGERPRQPRTPFVGREHELEAVGRLLANPAVRLLTLVGPGGVGKTRLALQLAARAEASFADGVLFVGLQDVPSPAFLLTAIVDALDIQFPEQQALEEPLFAYLRDRQLLLVLDNFEPDQEAAGVLAVLLDTTRHVQLLVTSREALNLSGEWLFPLEGLRYPPEPTSEPEQYGAIALFDSRARQVRPGFSLAEEAEAVLRICRQTEGLPLALELAASWVPTLSCREIADELQQNLDFLTSRWADVRPQHRSMRAVFQQSWTRLTAEEQAVFTRLSIFRGGFTRQAAGQVAGASLSILSTLLDRSLLRREPAGRYQIHELLRQYAAEQLARAPDTEAEVRARHGRTYAHFLQERTEALRGGRQREALAEIASDIENVRLFWEWALAQRQAASLAMAVEPLNQFYDFRGRYLEGMRAFEQAIEALGATEESPDSRRALALLHLYLGGLYLRVGRVEDAEQTLRHCQLLYREMAITPPPGYMTDPALLLGIIASVRGHFDEAARLGSETLQTAQASHHLLNQQVATYLLARAALLQGQLEEARAHAQQSYALTQATGDRWFMAYCLNELGTVAFNLGEYEAARQHYTASYKIRREFEDPEGMALALSHLGAVASHKGEHAEAERLYRESLTISRDINNRGSATLALQGLARNAVASGAPDEALPLLKEALLLVCEGHFASLFLSLLVEVAGLLAGRGANERATALLQLVMGHPASEPEARTRARQQLERAGGRSAHDVQPALAADAGWPALERLARDLLLELEMPVVTTPAPSPGAAEVAGAGALIEPLTEREVEVLALMAEGRSNPEIAAQLILAVGTVKFYTSAIYGKLGVRNRVEAVRRARELDLLS